MNKWLTGTINIVFFLQSWCMLLTNVFITDQAIAVLSGLTWNVEGQTCYACLCAIINHLLRNSLNAQSESMDNYKCLMNT